MSVRWLASLFYFAYFAAVGALIPYLNLYYRQSGMDTWQIGVLAALPTVTVMVASPLWGGIADAFNLHNRLLPLVTLGTLLPVIGLMQSGTFMLLGAFVLLHAALNAPVMPLADNAVLAGLEERTGDYGQMRIWGAVGFGVSAWAAGVLAEQRGMVVIFLLYLTMMLVSGLIAFRLPAAPAPPSEPFFLGLRRLMTNPRWLVFLGTVLLAGIAYAILSNYLIIYLDDLGAGEGLYGLSIAAAGISELPVYVLSPLLLNRWKPQGLIAVSLGALAVRSVAYALITDPRWSVAAQLLHGPTFSALWIAGVVFAAQIAPRELGASAQSAFGAVLFGLAGGAGALIGAGLYGSLGPQSAFLGAAVSSLAGLALFGWYELRLPDAPVGGPRPKGPGYRPLGTHPDG